MSDNNAIAPAAANAVAAFQNLKSGLSSVVETMKVKSGGAYLRLLKSGKWVYGQKDTELDPDTKWAMNVPSIEHGWVCWNRDNGADNSGGPLGEHMVPMGARLPNQFELPKHDHHEWSYQISVELVGTNGEDKGVRVIYKTNSIGGVGEMKKLLTTVAQTASVERPVPILALGVDSYKHRKYGLTFTPILKIVDYVSLDVTSLPEPGDDDDGNDEGGAAEDDAEAAALRALAEARAKKAAAAGGETAGATVRRRTRQPAA